MSELIPDVFCWSKMGAEAGEPIERIIRRKEIERRANGGLFMWGIGSSLGDSIQRLQMEVAQPSVLFTKMLCKAKKIDQKPRSLRLWVGGRTRDGERVDLPPYSLVTSRGETEALRRKKVHYALLCRSPNEIGLEAPARFDSGSVVNLGTGKPVGSSQVTAIVKKTRRQNERSRVYDVAFSAALIEQGQIILDRSVRIIGKDVLPALEAAEAGDVAGWKREVGLLKASAECEAEPYASDVATQLAMFAGQ